MSALNCGCDPDCKNQDGTIGHVCEEHKAYRDLLADWRAQDEALQEIYGICGIDEYVTCPADVVKVLRRYLSSIGAEAP